MSFKRVIKILEGFGFSRADATVYIYLAKSGPQKGKELRRGLELNKQQLYSELKRLHQKGAITRGSQRPALFSALAFEELLDLLVKANVEQAKAIKETKEELLANWWNMTKKKDNQLEPQSKYSKN